MDTLHQLRARIAEAQSERETLTEAAPSHAEMLAAFTKYVQRESDKFKTWAAVSLTDGPHQALRVQASPTGMVDLAPILGMLLGPAALTKLLTAALSASDIPDVPKASERARLVEQLTAELDLLERDEEAEVCRLEASGRVVARRPNVRPEIVLALPEGNA